MAMTNWALGVGLCGTLVSGVAWAAPTEQDFQLRTTRDLTALCAAAPTDQMGTAAINFCHGFALGVYRVLQQEQMASSPRSRLFCVPSPTPSRNEAIADFVRWAQATPRVLDQPPADGIAAYLVHKFPCQRSK